MNKIYLIPGLGADQRVFNHLTLAGETVFVQWVQPYQDENLRDYCRRLIGANGIEQNQILAGVSFGGIIASEIAKITRARQLILISSIRDKHELPVLFRLAGKLKLYALLPYRLLNTPNLFIRYTFGPLSAAEYGLLKQIIKDTDTHFLKWAIKQILEWPAVDSLPNTLHIHGTKDRIFDSKYVKKYIPVSGGGHFMIVNRAEEISQIINKHLVKNLNSC